LTLSGWIATLVREEVFMAQPAFPLSPEDAGRTWPVQGQWTYDDYLRLPDDGRRYEVIHGLLYVTPAPNYDHQFSVSQSFRLLGNFVHEGRLGIVLTSPFDVRLPGIASPVQPDLVFFRTGNQPRKGAGSFEGVPDLVVEVLSPATRRLDQDVKLAAYRDAGVPEYWLIDPRMEWVLVYLLSADRRRYVEHARGNKGDVIASAVLPGFRLAVSDLFLAG